MPDSILVTGASGLIGSQVLRCLDQEEADVVALSRSPRRREGSRRWIRCDLSQSGAVEAIVTSVRPNAIIHLAGEVRGERSLDAVASTLRTNLVATVELLEAATRVGCDRVVVSGSLLEEPASGSPDDVPPSPYGASRWAASAYSRMFNSLFGTPVVILRPSFAYGPGQEETKLIPHVITELLEGRSPELSSGDRLLDCVYAEDVARAYVRAAWAPGLDGRTLDLGSGDARSVRAIVGAIVEAVGASDGTPEFGRLPVRPFEQQVAADIEETTRVLGWSATTGLEEGLGRTVAWYRERLEGGYAKPKAGRVG